MRFPRAVSADALPRAHDAEVPPGPARRLAWSAARWRSPNPAYSPGPVAATEVFESALSPLADLSIARPDHFLRAEQYTPNPFLRGIGRDIVFTRVSRALGAPGHGFIDQFNVGGGANMPDDLLEREFVYEPDGALSVEEPEIERVPGVTAPFFHYGYTAFGHFVLDGLLQIHLYEDALHAGDLKLAHWPLQEPWMQPAIEACGLPARARRELRGAFVLLQRAAMSSALAAYGVYHPAGYSRRFFAWLAARVGGATGATADKIYIRRTPGSPRPIGNSAELEAFARAQGFEVFDPGEHSFAEQVRIFMGAETVLSPFGSTLTLAPLLRGRRRVIELLPDNVTDAWFFTQTTVHGLDYLPVLQRTESAGGFDADLEALGQALHRLKGAG